MKKKEALVVGAGPAGLVAAINLAREGFKVRILEKEKQIGGYPHWHPSAHDTPVGKNLFKYIGIDLWDCFQDFSRNFLYVINDEQVKVPIPEGQTPYACERGGRPTSLDSALFRIAVKEGVDFEFAKKCTQAELDKAPKVTVLATGLSTEMYEITGLPYGIFAGYFGQKEIADKTPRASIFFGGFSREYGYSSCTNGIYYVLLFSRKEVSDEHLGEFKKLVEKWDKVEFDHWKRFMCYIPITCNLFYKNRFILAGSLAGVVEPALGFGITGALLSGKIAALAAIDREKGQAEYDRYVSGVPRAIAKKKEPGYFPAPPPVGDVWFEFPKE